MRLRLLASCLCFTLGSLPLFSGGVSGNADLVTGSSTMSLTGWFHINGNTTYNFLNNPPNTNPTAFTLADNDMIEGIMGENFTPDLGFFVLTDDGRHGFHRDSQTRGCDSLRFRQHNIEHVAK